MLIIVFISLLVLNNCLAARIFMISTVPSLSHSMWNQKLAKILADRNHKITIIDVGKQARNHTNIEYHHLALPSYDDYFDLEETSLDNSPMSQLDLVFNITNAMCKDLLYLPQTKIFLNKYRMQKRPFDLIINDGGCCETFQGFVKVFGSPPVVQATAFSSATYLMEYAGLYDNPSYVPHASSALSQNMNFYERLENVLLYLKMFSVYHLSYIKNQNEIAKNFFEDDTIEITEISKNSKITLINTHPVLDGVKPYLPNIISIAGFHIEKPQPLEKDLQTFLDDAPNGVIYFSMGSNIKCEFMKPDKLNIFIKVFSRLKTKILWKCDMNLPNLPLNIRLGKWFKQTDILAHHNIKLFISHGGLLGTQEAIYHGVPMLILPFILDQHFISIKLERIGVARRLIYADLTERSLYDTINNLITDKSYKERMKERSELFRDTPISPRDLAVFWIEYVLRHPDTNLLRSPTQNMPVYQLIMLDIAALIIGIISVIILFLLILIKMCQVNKKKVKIS